MDRGIASELFHEIVDCTDMIDMTMGYTGSDDLLPTTVGEIWDRTIDTVLVLISELETHINDEHLIFVFESHTVQTNLLSSTEWDNAKCSLLEWLRALLWYVEELLECLLWCEERI
jgi:hypothetical protein